MFTKKAAFLLSVGVLVGSLAIPTFGQAQNTNQNQNPNQGGGGFGGQGGGGGFGGGQGGPGGGRGGFAQMFGPDGQIDPNMVQQFLQQIEQRQLDNIKDQLGATDDEFTVLQPKILKLLEMQFSNTVTQYAGQISAAVGPGGAPGGGPGGPGGPGGGRGGFGGGGGFMAAIQAALPPNELQQAAAALKMVLDDKDSSPDLIAAKLAEYRAAKVAANDQMVQAQNDFKSLLTQRQEGAMVLQGLIN
jgi:hypothetical protein